MAENIRKQQNLYQKLLYIYNSPRAIYGIDVIDANRMRPGG